LKITLSIAYGAHKFSLSTLFGLMQCEGGAPTGGLDYSININ